MDEKTTKRTHYDKRFIIEIVKQIEEGVPRKELREKYNLGKKSLDVWMRKFGSEVYHQNKRVQISKLDKRNIVAAVENGMSIREACVVFKIRTESCVRKWVQEMTKEKGSFAIPIKSGMAKGTQPSKETPSQGELEKALQEAQMKIVALNTLIDVAEQELKINIRKKSGAKRS